MDGFFSIIWFLLLGFSPLNETRVGSAVVSVPNCYTQQIGLALGLGNWGRVYTDMEVFDKPAGLSSWVPHRIDFTIGVEMRFRDIVIGAMHECDHDVLIPWKNQLSETGLSYSITRFHAGYCPSFESGPLTISPEFGFSFVSGEAFRIDNRRKPDWNPVNYVYQGLRNDLRGFLGLSAGNDYFEIRGNAEIGSGFKAPLSLSYGLGISASYKYLSAGISYRSQSGLGTNPRFAIRNRELGVYLKISNT